MGRTFLADIPGPHGLARISNSSVASNGANGYVGGFVAPDNIQILSVWRTVLADEATHGTASTSASYRRTRLLNGGATGTATAILASLNQTASQGSLTSKAFTVVATPTAPQGAVLWVDQLTVGGADNDGTVVAAGETIIAYQLL